MAGKVTNFYAGGNTARGFANLYESSLQGLNRLVLVEGGRNSEKGELFREIGERMVEEGHDTWYIHCASDNSSLDGLVFPDLKAGILDATSPREVVSQLPEEAVLTINLNDSLDAAKLFYHKSSVDRLTKDISLSFERAYAGFAEALRVHDDWEAVYIANMDFEAADQLTENLLQTLYQDCCRGCGEKAVCKSKLNNRVDHRFLGAATPLGAVDFVPDLTQGLKRYFVKGRPGSGKSTMLKKIAAVGTERGFDVEIYHCGFDPNSLDMVIVRKLGFAIFDSTAPHEYFPERSSDEIIDMYELCIKPGTDEEHAETIQVIREQYSAKMKESIQQLAKAKALQDELDLLCSECIDTSVAERLQDEIRQHVMQWT